MALHDGMGMCNEIETLMNSRICLILYILYHDTQICSEKKIYFYVTKLIKWIDKVNYVINIVPCRIFKIQKKKLEHKIKN